MIFDDEERQTHDTEVSRTPRDFKPHADDFVALLGIAR
jgi:hypothetical protein